MMDKTKRMIRNTGPSAVRVTLADGEVVVQADVQAPTEVTAEQWAAIQRHPVAGALVASGVLIG
jgi:hypothetical protein